KGRGVASTPMDGHALSAEAVREARAAMDRAYAPYAGFAVGAAVIANGLIFTGQNIENASYPVSVCAERNAVGRMIDAGERRIDAVAVVTAAEGPTPPCGACRQVLWEFAPEARVGAEPIGGEPASWARGDLLPSAAGGTGDAFVYEHRVRPTGARAICVVNKVDATFGRSEVPQLAAAGALGDYDEIVPVSARQGKGVGTLRRLILERIPEGPALYPEETITDQPLAVRLAETEREKELAVTRQEVPHSIAV